MQISRFFYKIANWLARLAYVSDIRLIQEDMEHVQISIFMYLNMILVFLMKVHMFHLQYSLCFQNCSHRCLLLIKL